MMLEERKKKKPSPERFRQLFVDIDETDRIFFRYDVVVIIIKRNKVYEIPSSGQNEYTFRVTD